MAKKFDDLSHLTKNLKSIRSSNFDSGEIYDGVELFEPAITRKSWLIDRTPFYYGYVVLFIGTMIKIFSGPGQSAVIGIFTADWIAEGVVANRTTEALLYCIATLMSAATLPFVVGRSLDRYGARKVTALVCFGLGCTCVLCGAAVAAGGPFVLFLCFYFLRLFGQGGMVTAGRYVINQWFVKGKGRAQGIATLGLSVGLSGAFPAIAVALRRSLGWKTTYIVLGSILVAVLTPLIYGFVRDSPEKYNLLPDGRKAVFEDSRSAFATTTADEHLHHQQKPPPHLESTVFSSDELQSAADLYRFPSGVPGSILRPETKLGDDWNESPAAERRVRFATDVQVLHLPTTTTDDGDGASSGSDEYDFDVTFGSDEDSDDEDDQFVYPEDDVWLGSPVDLPDLKQLAADNVTSRQALCSTVFWGYSIGTFWAALLMTGIYFDLGAILSERLKVAPADLDAIQSALYIVSAVVGGVFNLLTGFLLDKNTANGKRLFIVSLVLLSASQVVLGLCTTSFGVIVFAVISGVSSGLRNVVVATVYAELFGRRHLGAIQSTAGSLAIMGSALGPFPFSAAVDLGASYGTVLLVSASFPAINAVALIFMKTPPTTFNRQCPFGLPNWC